MLRWGRSWVIQKSICITASVNPEALKLEKATIGGVQWKRCSWKFCKNDRKGTVFASDTGFLLSILRNFWEHFFTEHVWAIFTEHFRATAFDEEAWWSKILIPSSFLKKIFVEIIGIFNSASCWKKELCNSPFWLFGSTLIRTETRPGLNSTLPMVKALFVVTCQSELKIQPYGYLNPVLTTDLKFELCYNSACF